jgi:hypothetical protein
MAALGAEADQEAKEFLEESVVLGGPIPGLHWRAFALGLSGYAALKLGRRQQAMERLRQALRFATETRAVPPLLYALPGMALLLADEGEGEHGAELYALASRYPFVANSRWFEDVAGRHIAAATAALPPDAVAAAGERGRTRDLWATAEELLAELEG